MGRAVAPSSLMPLPYSGFRDMGILEQHNIKWLRTYATDLNGDKIPVIAKVFPSLRSVVSPRKGRMIGGSAHQCPGCHSLIILL